MVSRNQVGNSPIRVENRGPSWGTLAVPKGPTQSSILNHFAESGTQELPTRPQAVLSESVAPNSSNGLSDGCGLDATPPMVTLAKGSIRHATMNQKTGTSCIERGAEEILNNIERYVKVCSAKGNSETSRCRSQKQDCFLNISDNKTETFSGYLQRTWS